MVEKLKNDINRKFNGINKKFDGLRELYWKNG